MRPVEDEIRQWLAKEKRLRPTFDIPLLDGRSLTPLLGALASINEMLMRDYEARFGSRFPALFSSGARYRRESPGEEIFKAADAVLRDGCGDCEDLSSYLAAEMRQDGDRGANAIWYKPKPRLFHCITMNGAGHTTDPSKKLGMGGKG